MTSTYKEFTIEVTNDDRYTTGSADNYPSYHYQYLSDIESWFSAKHGIRVAKDETEIASAIICETYGGSTTIHKRSYVLKDDAIFICCGAKIYSLQLPTLQLNWNKELDTATCFGIYEFENDFLIHGEMEISRLSADGVIKWKFSARDIFVSINGKKEFEIIGDKIKLIDFEDYEYTLNADGEVI